MTLTGSYSSKSKIDHSIEPPTRINTMIPQQLHIPQHNESEIFSEGKIFVFKKSAKSLSLTITIDPPINAKELDSEVPFSRLPSFFKDKSGVFDSKAFNEALKSLMTSKEYEPSDTKLKKVKTTELVHKDSIPALMSMNSMFNKLAAEDADGGLALPSLSRHESDNLGNLGDVSGLGRTFSTFSFIADKN